MRLLAPVEYFILIQIIHDNQASQRGTTNYKQFECNLNAKNCAKCRKKMVAVMLFNKKNCCSKIVHSAIFIQKKNALGY